MSNWGIMLLINKHFKKRIVSFQIAGITALLIICIFWLILMRFGAFFGIKSYSIVFFLSGISFVVIFFISLFRREFKLAFAYLSCSYLSFLFTYYSKMTSGTVELIYIVLGLVAAIYIYLYWIKNVLENRRQKSVAGINS